MIRFFFEYNNVVVQLPVNPEELTISEPGGNITTDVIKLGEINILRERKLKTCELECFFPLKSNSPYVVTKGEFKEPDFYIEFFEKILSDKKPCRFLVSEIGVNMLVSIEEFSFGYMAQDADVQYKLSISEYREYSCRVLIPEKKPDDSPTLPVEPEPPPRQPTGYAIGDAVIVNGRYFYTSYGAQPSNVFTNFAGKISHIVGDTNRPYRYHITTPSGGYRGWVAESQLSHP